MEVFCPQCGRIHTPNSAICEFCGAPLAPPPAPDNGRQTTDSALSTPHSALASGPMCPKCRRGNRPGAAYCTHCGFNLAGSGSQPIAPAHTDLPPIAYDKISADVTGNLPSGLTLKRRYRILRKTAQGGMGAVYEANDSEAPAGTRWAVKEISPAGLPPAERSQAIADFRREAQILATLQHPNLPHVVETFEEMGKHFLVMEFVAGRT